MKNEQLPTRTQALIFRGKATVFQIKRGVQNLLDREIQKFQQINLNSQPIISESITPLWTEKEPAEQFLQAGKIHNLRRAIKKLNGLQIPPNHIFSFWKHIGKTTRRKGFVAGRELREGCIIPNIGGGLCQLSNALYDTALKANFEIIERHRHTQVVRGSLAEQGRDATVFWNYVDLRFRAPNTFQIQADMDSENLTIRFIGEKKEVKNLVTISRNRNYKPDEIGSCATCGVNDCFRVVKPNENTLNFGRTAYLVDEFSPEFDEYIQNNRSSKAILFVPIKGKKYKKENYAWTTDGFEKTKQSLVFTALRSLKSRKLSQQGASSQKNLLEMYEKLAQNYAKHLSYDCLHLVIQQNLLPFLWSNGEFGGRTFDVLMTSLPMFALQERLDLAKTLHPESKTLSDFRAEKHLVEAERNALNQARKIITPHTEIASLFPDKSILLDWKIPEINPQSSKIKNQKLNILFPASTVGRKGVYELRESIRGLDVKLLLLGSILEGEDFWQGFDVEKTTLDEGLSKADLVMLPAFIEHKPHILLKAVAKGIPVIASKACGVANIKGVEIIVEGDAKELRFRIERILLTSQKTYVKNKQSPSMARY